MKIAFASCTKIQNQPEQPVWTTILAQSPDHLLLLGDNVYSPNLTGNQKKLEKRYRQQFVERNFRNLIQRVPYNAIWDDHDFGRNDIKGATVDLEYKNRSRDLFHHYMNCSTNLPHVYHSFVKGEVKFIMLDVRYYREKHARPDATVLGREQELWLEQELNHTSKFTVVCSGSCLTEGTEKLEAYDLYYPRLRELLKNRGRVLFLAGDVHENKLVEHDGFYEVISSGAGRDNLNNYGMLEYRSDSVVISLVGEKRARDNITATIDSVTWRLLL